MALLYAWNFDEASGAVTDVSGNGRGFTLTGNNVRTAAGSGYTYGGTVSGSKGLTQTANDNQDGPSITGLSPTNRTLMCWAKAPGGDPSWFLELRRTTEDTGVFGFLMAGGTFRFRAKNSSNTAFDVTITGDTTTFHHLAVTHDGTTLKVYRDGTLIGSGLSMAFPVWTATGFRIFDQSGSACVIDDVRYYDEVLTQGQISTLMSTPVSGSVDLTVQGASQAQTAANVDVNERVRYYTFEEGTDGGTPSVAGDYLALSGTVVYDDAAAAHGAMGLLSTNNSFLTLTSGTPDTGGFSVHFTPVAVTSGVPRVITLTDSANSFMCAFRVHTDTHFDVTDGSSTRQAVSTATWTAGVKYWVTGTLTGTGTSRTVAVKVYTDDGSTTPVWDSGSVAVTSANSNTWARVRVGNQGGTTGSMRIDDVRLYDIPAFAEPLAVMTPLTVNGASQAQAAGAPSPTQVHVLTVAPASQAQTGGSPALTQAHNLSVAGAAQAQVSGSPATTQAHNLTVNGASQAQTSGAVTLAQVHVLTTQGASQTQAAATVTLVYNSGLTSAGASQAQTAQAVALTQAHVLVVGGATQPQSAGNVSPGVTLLPADAAQAQAAGTPSPTQVHQLVVSPATQVQSSGAPTLAQTHVLVVAPVSQPQAAESPTLGQLGQLGVNAASQSQTSGSPTLAQQHQLTTQSASQAQVAGQVTLSSGTQLTVAASVQAQTSTTVVPVQQHQLAVHGAVQGQLAGSTTLQLTVTLAPSDAAHAQQAGSASPTQQHALATQSTGQAQVATTITLSQAHQLLAASASHAQTASSPAIGQPAGSTLTVQGATQPTRSTQLGDLSGPIQYSFVRLYLWNNGVKSPIRIAA